MKELFDYELYTRATHDFFGMALVVSHSKEAQALAVKTFKAAFGM